MKSSPFAHPRNLPAIAALVASVVLHGSVPATAAEATNALSAFVGTWKINLERSRMERAGPSGVQRRRAGTFTWVFTPVGTNLRMDIYAEYPAPAPNKVLIVRADGQQHACELSESCLSSPGNPKQQSYSFTQMNSHMLARVFQVNGESVEYNVYAVSQDGKTFVATSWNPETPEYQNVQVFERQ